MRKWHFFVRQPLHLILLLILCSGLWAAGLIPGVRVSHSGNVTVGSALGQHGADGPGRLPLRLRVVHYYRTELPDMAVIHGESK